MVLAAFVDNKQKKYHFQNQSIVPVITDTGQRVFGKLSGAQLGGVVPAISHARYDLRGTANYYTLVVVARPIAPLAINSLNSIKYGDSIDTIIVFVKYTYQLPSSFFSITFKFSRHFALDNITIGYRLRLLALYVLGGVVVDIGRNR